MSNRSNLKLVETTTFEEKAGSFWNLGASSEDLNYVHSLHQTITYPTSFSAEFVSYFLSQYSVKGDVVLDPFCSFGTVPLESNLHGRIAAFSDLSPLAMKLTSTKVDPADITDVTLFLQSCNVRRPINLSAYSDHFKPFFDLDTFRELVNVKVFLSENKNSISRFIELIVMSLLHGNSAGYFSVYTSPIVSLSPSEQDALNIKRSQLPDYRAVLPRILRKAATVLRDGVSGSTRLIQQKNNSALCDARDLGYLTTSSVNMVITAPPLPYVTDPFEQMWLRSWFAGVANRQYADSSNLEGWRGLMNESVLELARVTKSGGRAVFNLKQVKVGKELIELDKIFMQDTRASFSKYWDVEGLIINQPKSSTVKNRNQEVRKEENSERVVVLRRR
jgi:DNA modification methylase